MNPPATPDPEEDFLSDAEFRALLALIEEKAIAAAAARAAAEGEAASDGTVPTT